jgi:steroid delta-isomerase-like uncharacterized protein
MRRIVAVVLILVLAAGLGPTIAVAAQEASPAASPTALPSPLAEWLAAFNAGDTDRLLTLYTDDALWEEVAIGLAAHGPAQIRSHLDNLFTAVPDIAYEVSNSVVTDNQAVLEWVATGTYLKDFPGLPPAAGQSFSFRGASVFVLTDGKIQRYTEYWDAFGFLVQLGALPAPGAAPSSAATPAAQTGVVTIRVFTCPADLSQPAGQGQLDQSALLAACTPLPSPAASPTLRTLPDGAPKAGAEIAPGVYRWEQLPFGDYAVGVAGEMPADLSSLLPTDATGTPLQNPVLRLDRTAPEVEYRYFYFVAEATPVA